MYYEDSTWIRCYGCTKISKDKNLHQEETVHGELWVPTVPCRARIVCVWLWDTLIQFVCL